MDALSSPITKKSRSPKPVSDHRFERVFDYVKVIVNCFSFILQFIFIKKIAKV
ncbi:hypothetical protein Hanom_Chr01g00013611 [Helianthus anomalus]